jgi:hypothetical protein
LDIELVAHYLFARREARAAMDRGGVGELAGARRCRGMWP